MSKIILVTGANTGIGFQIVRALYGSENPYIVIVGSRSGLKGEEAIGTLQAEFPSSSNTLHPLQIDIEYDESIQKAYEEVQAKFGKIDALVNNAGALFDLEVVEGKSTEREAWNKSWNVNVSGTQVMTSTFAPLLLQSTDPRLLFITSGTANLTGSEDKATLANRNPAKGWPKTGFSVPAYSSAKTGLNMMMREWHRIFQEDGVKVWAISPGALVTGLGGNPELVKKLGGKDPAVAGPFIRGILEGERDGDVGKVVTRDGIQTW